MACASSTGSLTTPRRSGTRRTASLVACLLTLLFAAPSVHAADPWAENPLLLPDGRAFELWERPARHTRTLHVAQGHAAASDDNDGSVEAPFRTIQAAAEVVQPGERVLIHAGVYREKVRPRRGGTGPDAMVTYQAAPGEEVVITGAESYPGPWEPQTRWNPGCKERPREGGATGTVYHVRLPREWFTGYLPFGMVNLPQHAPHVLGRRGDGLPR